MINSNVFLKVSNGQASHLQLAQAESFESLSMKINRPRRPELEILRLLVKLLSCVKEQRREFELCWNFSNLLWLKHDRRLLCTARPKLLTYAHTALFHSREDTHKTFSRKHSQLATCKLEIRFSASGTDASMHLVVRNWSAKLRGARAVFDMAKVLLESSIYATCVCHARHGARISARHRLHCGSHRLPASSRAFLYAVSEKLSWFLGKHQWKMQKFIINEL